MITTRLGHVHLKVRDLDRAEAFYRRFLGLHRTERIGDALVFLSGGDPHHEVALQQVGPEAPPAVRQGVGLYHSAFEVPDRRTLGRAYRALTEAGVPVHPVDHRISWALYFSDPDGNGLEIYWDTRGEPGGTPRWAGASRPLTPAQLLDGLDDD